MGREDQSEVPTSSGSPENLERDSFPTFPALRFARLWDTGAPSISLSFRAFTTRHPAHPFFGIVAFEKEKELKKRTKIYIYIGTNVVAFSLSSHLPFYTIHCTAPSCSLISVILVALPLYAPRNFPFNNYLSLSLCHTHIHSLSLSYAILRKSTFNSNYTKHAIG